MWTSNYLSAPHDKIGVPEWVSFLGSGLLHPLDLVSRPCIRHLCHFLSSVDPFDFPANHRRSAETVSHTNAIHRCDFASVLYALFGSCPRLGIGLYFFAHHPSRLWIRDLITPGRRQGKEICTVSVQLQDIHPYSKLVVPI